MGFYCEDEYELFVNRLVYEGILLAKNIEADHYYVYIMKITDDTREIVREFFENIKSDDEKHLFDVSKLNGIYGFYEETIYDNYGEISQFTTEVKSLDEIIYMTQDVLRKLNEIKEKYKL